MFAGVKSPRTPVRGLGGDVGIAGPDCSPFPLRGGDSARKRPQAARGRARRSTAPAEAVSALSSVVPPGELVSALRTST